MQVELDWENYVLSIMDMDVNDLEVMPEANAEINEKFSLEKSLSEKIKNLRSYMEINCQYDIEANGFFEFLSQTINEVLWDLTSVNGHLFKTFWKILDKGVYLLDDLGPCIKKGLQVSGILRITKKPLLIESPCDEICAICIESSVGQWVRLNCDHKFHGKCVEIWFYDNVTCPMCREEQM